MVEDTATILAAIADLKTSVATEFVQVWSEISVLRERIDKKPALRPIGHNIQILIERVGALDERVARAVAAINDVARESVTPGGVEVLHGALRDVREREIRYDARSRRLEEEARLPPGG